MRRKGLLILLAFVMVCSFFPVLSRADMMFADVPIGAWYYRDVKIAYEGGLIHGKSASKFAPEDYMTYAEAVKLAACMHQKYTTGNVTLMNGSPWYQTYADYGRFHKIINRDYPWNVSVSRAGYMEIFAKALPDSGWSVLNDVPDGSIPDVPMSLPQAADIYKLYRAGIVQGVNAEHFCHPSTEIKRSEVAAILTRMMNPKERLKFSMKPDEPNPTPERFEVIQHPRDWEMSNATEEVQMKVAIAGGEKPYSYEWFMAGTMSSSSKARRVSKTESTEQHHTLYYRVTEEDFKEFGRVFLFCIVKDKRGDVAESRRAEVYPSSEFKIEQQPEDYHMLALYDTVEMAITVSGGKRPYTFEWWSGTKPQALEKKITQSVSMDSKNTLVQKVGESWFEMTKDLYITCVVTDDRGKTLTSESAKVIPYQMLKIVTHPKDVEIAAVPGKMTALIEIQGGTAPYIYEWRKGGKEKGRDELIMTFKTPLKEHLLGYTVSEEDFNTYGTEFFIYCIVTDAKGTKVVSNSATVIRIRGEAGKESKKK